MDKTEIKVDSGIVMDKEKLNILKPIYDKYAVIPNTDRTYCNIFVNEAMEKLFNYHNFSGLLANGICAVMDYHKHEWEKVKDPFDKGFIIASYYSSPHGHVCIVTQPLGMEFSGKWNKFVPFCANIGKNNFWGKGINYAFGKEEPIYYKFIKDNKNNA